MSHTEEIALRRRFERKMIIAGAAVAFTGALPLLLYLAFGPAHGNPIGLGLLAVVAILVGGIGMIIGLLKLLVEHFVPRDQ